MPPFDVAVIGAGAAGMMCAAVAGQRGKRVVLIEHTHSPGEKIRISGGGRSNFTNLGAGPENFLSSNPRFCRSALAGYSPQDFVTLVRRHGISFHEKHLGQLFCDDSAIQIIDMLRAECESGGVAWRLGCAILGLGHESGRYLIETAAGSLAARALVVATGGLSIPKIGASDFGYRVARQFGIRIIEPRPGLVPFVFDSGTWLPMVGLAGLSVKAEMACQGAFGQGRFREDLLFTHRGLSGPAALQISNYWQPGKPLAINLAPDLNWAQLVENKGEHRGSAAGLLATRLPRRLADQLAKTTLAPELLNRPMAELPDKALRSLAAKVSDWRIVPSGTEGFRKAEVTVGGVDTRELSSQTMEARRVQGLYFIGEVVDVTGWLGGYNFQWAWASAVACAKSL